MNPKDFSQFHAAVERIRTNSALNPLLWLCGITIPTSLVTAIFIEQTMKFYALGIALIAFLLTIFAYFVVLFRDPDRLQSEDYLTRKNGLLYDDSRNKITNIIDSTPTLNTKIESHHG